MWWKVTDTNRVSFHSGSDAIAGCQQECEIKRERIDGRSSLKSLHTDNPVLHLGCSNRPGHRHNRPYHHNANKDHAGIQRLWPKDTRYGG